MALSSLNDRQWLQFQMKQSRHLNPSEQTGTGCPVTSKYGRKPLIKHGGVGRQQQQHVWSWKDNGNISNNEWIQAGHYCLSWCVCKCS